MKRVLRLIIFSGLILVTSQWTGITVIGFSHASYTVSFVVGVIAIIVGTFLLLTIRKLDKLADEEEKKEVKK